MSRFARSIGNLYVAIGGCIIAAIGTAVALKNDIPWLAFGLLVPLVVVCFVYAWNCLAGTVRAEASAKHATDALKRKEAELAQVSTASLEEIRRLIGRYGLQDSIEALCNSLQTIERMTALAAAWGQPPPVIGIEGNLDCLFVITRLPPTLFQFVRESDVFLLRYKESPRAISTRATLRVNQPPANGILVLLVEQELVDGTVQMLQAMSLSGNTTGMSQLSIEIPFDTQPFRAVRVDLAIAALDAMRRNVNNYYLREVADGKGT